MSMKNYVDADGVVTERDHTARRQWDVRRLYGYVSALPSRTKQAMRDECDINNIMERYQKSGLITHVNRYEGRYEDLTNVVDYGTAFDIVKRAEEMFMTLPSGVRARFLNDPGVFLRFVDDPANAQELVELGLARRRDATPPGVPSGAPAGSQGHSGAPEGAAPAGAAAPKAPSAQ